MLFPQSSTFRGALTALEDGYAEAIAAESAALSYAHCYPCVQYFRVEHMVWLPVFGIFNVRTDVDACPHAGSVPTE